MIYVSLLIVYSCNICHNNDNKALTYLYSIDLSAFKWFFSLMDGGGSSGSVTRQESGSGGEFFYIKQIRMSLFFPGCFDLISSQ